MPYLLGYGIRNRPDLTNYVCHTLRGMAYGLRSVKALFFKILRQLIIYIIPVLAKTLAR